MSQQAYAQHYNQKLEPASQPQLGLSLSRASVGIEARFVALLLAALCLSATLLFAVANAWCTKSGYTSQGLRRNLEDMRSLNELLRYQINLSQSNYQVDQHASALAMRPVQAAEVDYVVLPQTDRAFAELDPAARAGGLRGAWQNFTAEMARPNTGRAEASTSHRF